MKRAPSISGKGPSLSGAALSVVIDQRLASKAAAEAPSLVSDEHSHRTFELEDLRAAAEHDAERRPGPEHDKEHDAPEHGRAHGRAHKALWQAGAHPHVAAGSPLLQPSPRLGALPSAVGRATAMRAMARRARAVQRDRQAAPAEGAAEGRSPSWRAWKVLSDSWSPRSPGARAALRVFAPGARIAEEEEEEAADLVPESSAPIESLLLPCADILLGSRDGCRPYDEGARRTAEALQAMERGDMREAMKHARRAIRADPYRLLPYDILAVGGESAPK